MAPSLPHDDRVSTVARTRVPPHGGPAAATSLLATVPHPLVTAAGAAALALVCGAPYWMDHPLAGLLACGLTASLAALGAVYIATGAGRRMGLCFLIAALLHCLSWTAAYDSGVLPVVSESAQSFFFLFVGMGCLLFGQPRFGTWVERAWTAQAVLTLGAVQLSLFLLAPPTSLGYAPDVAWPTVVDLPDDAMAVVLAVGEALYLLLAVSFAAALVARRRAVRGIDRAIALPVWIGAGFLGIAAAAVQVRLMRPTPTFDDLMEVHVLQALAATSVPLALFASSAWQRWREYAVAVELHRRISIPTVDEIEAALRETLDDPALHVWVFVPPRGGYLGARGAHREPRTIEDRPARHASAWLAIEHPDGGRLAVFQVGEKSAAQHTFVQATLASAATPLVAAQLELVRLEEVRKQQERLLEVERETRQAVVRDLHDGVQQRLLALAVELNRLARTCSDPGTRRHIVESADDVVEINAELRRIARGVHPPLLTEMGLAAALEEVAERVGDRIELDIRTGRLEPVVEVALYYALTEAVVNAHKHASATKVSVTVRKVVDEVVGTVVDDGVGGAVARVGGGLHGVEDRVGALGGRIEFSPTPRGTEFVVHLPVKG